MSYSKKYERWVKRQIAKKKEKGMDNADEIHSVYREMPILTEMVNDNPPEYRFIAPRTRARTIDQMHMKIDKKLDSPPPTQRQKNSDSEYFGKWENCKLELEKMKKQEAKWKSEFDKLQATLDSMKTQVRNLESESVSLKKQLKEAKSKIESLE